MDFVLLRYQCFNYTFVLFKANVFYGYKFTCMFLLDKVASFSGAFKDSDRILTKWESTGETNLEHSNANR
jgi:hypothetical protein